VALVQKAQDEFWDDRSMSGFVPIEELFKGRHFDQEIVVLCVRWYLSFKLSYRDLVAMMGERGIGLAHTTILRWVQQYTRSFRNAGIGSPDRSAEAGAWMRPTSG
jgi:transposase-like protein